MTYQDRPSEKQQAALRRYKIPEAEIQKMTFQDASDRLHLLIEASKARKAQMHPQGNQAPNASVAQTKGTQAPASTLPLGNTGGAAEHVQPPYSISKAMEEAKLLVAQQFPDADYSIYAALIAEAMRERFELYLEGRKEAYWGNKVK